MYEYNLLNALLILMVAGNQSERKTIMLWTKTLLTIPRYLFASSNQHGMRYKRISSKRVSCAKLEAKVTDAVDLRNLILLSHHLDAPVHYNFDVPQTAFIEIVSKEAAVHQI